MYGLFFMVLYLNEFCRVIVRPTETGAMTDRPAEEGAVLWRRRVIVFFLVGGVGVHIL
jgi:hypothetical protein